MGLLSLDFVSFWFLGTGWISEHLCTRRVSLRYRFGYRFGTGENVQKKEQFQVLHAIINELMYFKILQGIAFDSSPYRFPWFGAPFKKKERLTRRLLHEEFSRFLTCSFEHVSIDPYHPHPSFF